MWTNPVVEGLIFEVGKVSNSFCIWLQSRPEKFDEDYYRLYLFLGMEVTIQVFDLSLKYSNMGLGSKCSKQIYMYLQSRKTCLTSQLTTSQKVSLSI